MTGWEEELQGIVLKAKTAFQEQQSELCKTEIEAKRYQNIIFNCLSSMIGEPIYWASSYWPNIETHRIKAVSYGAVETDFFGSEFKGKPCIKIFTEDGGFYIADDIGKTLFFSKVEAKKHVEKYYDD